MKTICIFFHLICNSKYKGFLVAGLLINYFNSLTAQQPSYENCNCGAMVDIRYFSIQHFHRINGHSEFDQKTLKKKFCITAEFTDTIEVVSDGSKSSVLEVYGEGGGCSKLNFFPEILDYDFNPVDTTATEEYGQLNTLASQKGFGLYKFEHPTKTPPDGQPYGLYYIQFKNNNGFVFTSFVVKYYRPAVAMVHGLWSDGTAFLDMWDYLKNSGNYEPFQLLKVNYRSSNDEFFSSNSKVVPDAIKSLISSTPSAGKVDVVCHSMGGVLTRLYLKNPLFTSNKDIRRVITCNTPHAGSQMANWLLDPTQYGTTVADALGKAGMNCYKGAVSDLRVGYPTINGVAYGSINGEVEVHAIVTEQTLGNIIFSTSASYMGLFNFYASLALWGCGSLFLEDIFNSPNHDFIVASQSQKGGLPTTNTTTYNSQEHMGSVANPQVMTRVQYLLNQPPGAPVFADSYSGFALTYNVNVPCAPFTDHETNKRSNMTPSLEITSPSFNSSIPGGSTMNLTYTASEIDSVMCFIRVKNDTVLTISNSGAAGSLNIPIPSYLFGKKKVVLIGVNTQNRIVASDSITINFTTSASLTGIIMDPPRFHMLVHDTMGYTIYGQYSDGIKRILSGDMLQFEFKQMKASITGGDRITLNNFGYDTLVIKQGSLVSNPVFIRPIGHSYPVGCHIVTTTSDDGPGSLRQALECVSPMDTIFFSAAIAGDTIDLSALKVFYIDKNAVLLNNNTQPVIIRSPADYVMTVTAESVVQMKNIHIQSYGEEKVCLMNFGNITVENSEFFTVNQDKARINNEGMGKINFKGTSRVR